MSEINLTLNINLYERRNSTYLEDIKKIIKYINNKCTHILFDG